MFFAHILARLINDKGMLPKKRSFGSLFHVYKLATPFDLSITYLFSLLCSPSFGMSRIKFSTGEWIKNFTFDFAPAKKKRSYKPENRCRKRCTKNYKLSKFMTVKNLLESTENGIFSYEIWQSCVEKTNSHSARLIFYNRRTLQEDPSVNSHYEVHYKFQC
jgi:hypothetical protein